MIGRGGRGPLPSAATVSPGEGAFRVRRGAAAPEVDDPVTFGRFGAGPYGVFSPYSPHALVIAGMVWPTVEHLYQGAKFDDARHGLLIGRASTPEQAWVLGQARSVPLRAQWGVVRVAVMAKALHAKFVQHPRLADVLARTGRRPLIARTFRDRFWGGGSDGLGLNVMGRLLEEVREELRCGPQVPGWAAGGLVACPQWVAFGDTTLVVPSTRGRRNGGGIACRARAVLLEALRPTVPLVLRSIDGPVRHQRISVAGGGEILLRRPSLPALADRAGLGRLLVSAAAEPITVVHDARWPREPS